MMIRRKTRRRWVRLVVGLILTVAWFWVLFGEILGMKRVVGNDLEPDLRDGDLVFYERLLVPKMEDVVVWPDGKIGRWHGEKDSIGRAVILWRGRGI